MGKKLTVEDAKQSLTAHVAQKGAEIRAKYGAAIGWNEMLRILEDRTVCRYPCELLFEAEALQTGEFAFPMPKGDRPEDGFKICVHPHFALERDRVVYLVFYQLVQVNYGEFATGEDAEAFGAAALGLSTAEYYDSLCKMADEIGGFQQETGPGCDCSH